MLLMMTSYKAGQRSCTSKVIMWSLVTVVTSLLFCRSSQTNMQSITVIWAARRRVSALSLLPLLRPLWSTHSLLLSSVWTFRLTEDTLAFAATVCRRPSGFGHSHNTRGEKCAQAHAQPLTQMKDIIWLKSFLVGRVNVPFLVYPEKMKKRNET